MNSVNVIGNLTADVELKFTQSGKAVATFRLAVNDGQEAPTFVPVVVWEKQAESCANYLQKGSKAGVTGRLQSRSWETPEGQKRTILEVVASRVDFLTKKDEQPGAPPKGGGSLGQEIDLGTDDGVPF
jgi:single-strand DNA-binding protein